MIEDFADKIIGGRRFRILNMDARTSVHVQTRLAGALGPGFVGALSTIDGALVEGLVAFISTVDMKEFKDATKRSELLSDFGKRFGGPLFKLLSEAVSGLSTRLDDKTTDYLIDAIFKKCVFFPTSDTRNGLEVSWDLFEARPLELWELVIAGLKFNFGPFITAIQGRLSPVAQTSDSNPLPQVAT